MSLDKTGAMYMSYLHFFPENWVDNEIRGI